MSDASCGSRCTVIDPQARMFVYAQTEKRKVMRISRILIAVVVLALVGWSERGEGQTLTTLWQFSGGADGGTPRAGLVQGSDSNFYGTTEVGGASGSGTVFSISSIGNVTNLWSFTGGVGGGGPVAGLVQGTDGSFYGTTAAGGASDWGTVFKITSAGTLTTLCQFNFATNGANPVAGLVQGTDGNFYGTTLNGGTARRGTVFQITSAGTLTTLYNFAGVLNGGYPGAGLVQGSDSNFYGSTRDGGTFDAGMAFKITSAGTLNWLCSFLGDPDDEGGANTLIQGSDSSFYGTTFGGGGNFKGTVFALTSQGTLTTLNSLSQDAGPAAGLVQGSDGDFYGTTLYGGVEFGAVFKVTSAGTFTSLYSFKGGAEGAGPEANLVQGSDGNFYGTTSLGGTNNAGTIFRLIPPCTYLLSTGPVTVASSGGSGTFGINSTVVSPDATNCAWTATNTVAWIAITSASSGEGDGTISYSVAANPDGMTRVGAITIADQTFAVDQMGATVVAFSFSNIVQTCKSKTKINKKAMTTNVTTTCTIAFDLVASNTGVTNSSAFSVLLWPQQGSSFNPGTGSSSQTEKVNGLLENKSEAVKVKDVFIGDQAGTFIFLTDTNQNVLGSVEVPAP
jgi:uncharacterized repeat protein (TIGR03803 family)